MGDSTIWVRPKAGQAYRHTRTRALVPPEGFAADPLDLDIVRALNCGDLVAELAKDPAPAKRRGKAAAAPDVQPSNAAAGADPAPAAQTVA